MPTSIFSRLVGLRLAGILATFLFLHTFSSGVLVVEPESPPEVGWVSEEPIDGPDLPGVPWVPKLGCISLPRGVTMHLESDAAGTNKTIVLGLDTGDAPPVGNEDAPTRLYLVADRSADGWAVQYAMYHPSWLYSDEAQMGVESFVLVNAVSELGVDAPAAMRVIALPGAFDAVPANPDQDWSICSYLAAVEAASGPTRSYVCEDNNPFYILSSGAVQEGGQAPASFESLAPSAAALDFGVADLVALRSPLFLF